jgi:hypothetical protein
MYHFSRRSISFFFVSFLLFFFFFLLFSSLCSCFFYLLFISFYFFFFGHDLCFLFVFLNNFFYCVCLFIFLFLYLLLVLCEIIGVLALKDFFFKYIIAFHFFYYARTWWKYFCHFLLIPKKHIMKWYNHSSHISISPSNSILVICILLTMEEMSGWI